MFVVPRFAVWLKLARITGHSVSSYDSHSKQFLIMKENKLNFHHALKISVVAEDLITGENNFFLFLKVQ